MLPGIIYPLLLTHPMKNVINRSAAKKTALLQKGRGRWIVIRKATQYVTLIFFIIMVFLAINETWASKLLDTIIQLDPLSMLSHLLASRTILATSAYALILVMMTIVIGRAWCGWLCPLGTILDLLTVRRKNTKRSAPAEGLRKVKYDLVLLTLAAALLGNLTLLFLDPLAILMRTITVGGLPALDRILTAIESTLFHISFMEAVTVAVDSWLRPAVLPLQPIFYRDTILFTSIFTGLILLNYFAPRFWCRYLCPLGGTLGLLSKVSIFQRRVDEECKGCTLCTNICPTGTINPKKDYQSDPAECTVCMECVDTCPRGLNSFKPRFSKPSKTIYDPDAKDALTAVGAAIIGVALIHSTQLVKNESPTLLRPPGARENNIDPVGFTKCIRCGECMRVCPTSVLQPSVSEAGMAGLGTPILITRLGYCDYSCNACGQACPVQAIPPLPLQEKQKQVVGKAFINESRCIAWSDHRPCIVCQEMCPLPEKAIELEEAIVWTSDGQTQIKLPHVLRDLCIGCGICEYRCPVGGEAAIRIYTPIGSGAIYSIQG
jgi:polyferredoxin